MATAPNNFREYLRDFEEDILEITRITAALIRSEGVGDEGEIFQQITSNYYSDNTNNNNGININTSDIVDNGNNVQQ